MSLINFADLAKERPDLKRALERIAKWLAQNRDKVVIPSILARQIRDVDPVDLASALMLLSKHGFLIKRYKVVTPSGAYADRDYGNIAEIPQRLPDRFNHYFDTADADVLPVFVREGNG